MRTVPLLLAFVLLTACRKPEPVERADYIVQNNTANGLRIEHTPSINLDKPLVTDTVPPGANVRFLSVSMGSGGHTMPSNFFSAFSLMAGDSLVYSGVQNSDWRLESGTQGARAVVLVID